MFETYASKIALVTGANRGIGLEIVRQLAEKGAAVVLTGRDAEKAKTAAESLEETGLKIDVCRLDVTDPASVENVKQYVLDNFGRLDILVNNAGVAFDLFNDFRQTPLEKIFEMFNTNLLGAVLMCRAFVPLMEKNDYGRIVNVTSRGIPGKFSAYNLSKKHLNEFTRQLAASVASRNILVNAASPGWVRTHDPSAPLSVEEGADTIVWLAGAGDGSPSGQIFEARRTIEI